MEEEMKFDRLFETPEMSIQFSDVDIIDEYIVYYKEHARYDDNIISVLQELRKHLAEEEKPERYNEITFIHTLNGVRMECLKTPKVNEQ